MAETNLKPRNTEQSAQTDKEKTEAAQKAAAAAKSKDTSAAVPSAPAEEKSKPKTRPNIKSQIPTATIFFIDDNGSLGKDGESKGLTPKEALNTYLNGMDEEEQDEAVEQTNYAAMVNGKIEYFEISSRREFVLTPVNPDSF